MNFWIVDAFAAKPFSGNPAGVVLLNEFPTDQHCQNIAAEVGLSETAFVKPLKNERFHIRWFTPKTEVKLCGHATLASAHVLYNELSLKKDVLCFDSLSGELRTKRLESKIILDFPLQKTGTALELVKYQSMFGGKVIAAVKAYDDILIELNDENAVRNFQPSMDKISELDCRGIIITAKANQKYDFISRFFAPRVGVTEDPVTGSAHCKLAYYWSNKLGKTTFLAYQASARGGEISLEIKKDRVFIAGEAVTTICGDLCI